MINLAWNSVAGKSAMDGQLVVFKFKLTTKCAEFSNKQWGYLFNKTGDGTWSPVDISSTQSENSSLLSSNRLVTGWSCWNVPWLGQIWITHPLKLHTRSHDCNFSTGPWLASLYTHCYSMPGTQGNCRAGLRESFQETPRSRACDSEILVLSHVENNDIFNNSQWESLSDIISLSRQKWIIGAHPIFFPSDGRNCAPTSIDTT